MSYVCVSITRKIVRAKKIICKTLLCWYSTRVHASTRCY